MLTTFLPLASKGVRPMPSTDEQWAKMGHTVRAALATAYPANGSGKASGRHRRRN